jgi:protein ImuB
MVTVWCPDWPVVAAALATDEPAVVLHANRVIARSPAAAAEGVVIGQRRRTAQRCCPDAVLLDHDPDRDAREFEPVVRAVARFAPRLDVVEPGWLCLSARGPSRYFGGDERLAERLLDAVAGVVAGIAAGVVAGGVGIGIADGRFPSAVAARMAAERGRPLVVPPGASAAFTAPLPVAWLSELGEAPPELVGLFARLGLARLGDLAALPAGDVLARFGEPGRHAHRLAGGADERPPGGDEPPPLRGIEHHFDEPVAELATAAFVAKHLADGLVAGLAAEGRVCTRLVVTAETEHGERSERAWYRATGMSAPAMVERVRWQLDGWAMSEVLTSGVVLLRLVPDEVRAGDGDQLGLWGGRSAADDRAARAVARLTGLVGEAGVLVPAWQGGRLPGDRYRWVPAATADLADADDTAGRLRPDPGVWPGALPAPSPAVVLPQLRPAELVDVDGRPVRVSGRGELSADPVALAIGGGPPRPVDAWAGPWPVDERWWAPARHRRVARMQVITADGGAHLVLAEHHRWWVAAAYG